jgi:cytochrome oxidase Cu insertion factor (SCO1/SenC/PrrC family)
MSEMKLEPVVPDPKKLRRTALILVLIMIVGGVVILKAYEKRSKEGAKDDRPSFVTQISETKDLTFMRQDGEVTDLISLKGKVLVVQSLPQSQPDEMTTGVMGRLAGKFSGNDDVVLVTLMLDPGPAVGLQAELDTLATDLGAELPQWLVGSNDKPTLHRFIKNEFKANMMPHEVDGDWKYDQSIVLIDRNRHVRRAVIPQKNGRSYVVPFDFEQAQEWDRDGIKTGNDLTNTGQMEELLGSTLEILLDESLQKKKGIEPARILLGVGLGFVLLIGLILLKSRSSRKQTMIS